MKLNMIQKLAVSIGYTPRDVSIGYTPEMSAVTANKISLYTANSYDINSSELDERELLIITTSGLLFGLGSAGGL